MAIVNGSVQQGYKDGAWFTANATLVLLEGQRVNLLGTGLYKIGDEVTELQNLPFLGSATIIPNGLQTGGAISVNDDDVTVAPASWLISPDIYETLVDTDFLDIPFSASGLQRYIGFYGDNANTITKVEGSESEIAAYPATPLGTIVIGYVLVSDSGIVLLPDLTGFEEKVNKASTVIGNETSNVKYPSVKALVDWVTSLFVKKGTLTTNKLQKATASDTIGDSQITDDGTNIDFVASSTMRVKTGRVTVGGANSDSPIAVNDSVFAVDNSGYSYRLSGSIMWFFDSVVKTFTTIGDNFAAIGTFTNHSFFIRANNTNIIEFKNTGEINLPGLTASKSLALDGSKNVITLTKTTEQFTIVGSSQALVNTPKFVYGVYIDGQFARVGGMVVSIVGNLITFDADYTGRLLDVVLEY